MAAAVTALWPMLGIPGGLAKMPQVPNGRNAEKDLGVLVDETLTVSQQGYQEWGPAAEGWPAGTGRGLSLSALPS